MSLKCLCGKAEVGGGSHYLLSSWSTALLTDKELNFWRNEVFSFPRIPLEIGKFSSVTQILAVYRESVAVQANHHFLSGCFTIGDLYFNYHKQTFLANICLPTFILITSTRSLKEKARKFVKIIFHWSDYPGTSC